MIKRILTVFFSIPVIFFLTWFGGFWFFLMVTTLAIISLNEFYNMMKGKGFSPYYTIGNLFTLAIIVFIHNTLKHPNWEPVSSAILTSAVIVTFSVAIVIRRSAMATANIAITLLGTLYIGWLFSYLVLLRALTPHGAFLFLLMFTVWANDTVAYFFGKKFGKRQLSPYISPKKTISGSAAGFLAALAVAYVFGMIFEKALIPSIWPHYLIMGALIGIIGQVSDLSESLIKRDAGVKDSSNLVPGHGGVLDRMDSFIFAAPALYYYLTWFVLK